MDIKTLVLGSYQTNSYVIKKHNNDSECVIIDTGLENSPLLSYLKENNLKPVALILTHGHLDHILGISEIRENYPDIKVCIHKDDAEMITDPSKNLSASSAIYTDFTSSPADILLSDNQSVVFAEMEFEVLHVPGHTPGGICIYNKDSKIAFTGDCIFAGSVGRTDFPGYAQGKCHQQLIDGLKEKICTLPDDTRLFPGHGPSTTVTTEKMYNPFLNE